MTNFIVIEKDSLEKSIVNSNQITLTEASIVHTKMHRDDVEEFIRDGNNLLLKLKNGEVIVIENFFTAYDEVISDLVFEEDGCVLYWFDGVSDFKGIPGLEVLLPEAGSQLVSLLPWLAGLGAVGGVIAATHNDDDNSPSTPNGTNSIQVTSSGLITGKTENIPDGSKVNVTITGEDKDGNLISREIETTVNPDGSYTVEVPNDFADGDLKVESEVVDQNGNVVKAEDNLSGQDGLDRVDGTITVDVDNTGHITGGTTDVAPGSEVILTITGQDQAGNPLEQQVTATVQPDGSYTAEVPAGFADGELTVEAETVDRNGTPLNAEDNLSGQDGLDRVDGTITVDVDNTGHITGGTTDVAPGSEVILTITGQDQAGNPLEQQVTATVQPDGSYTAEVPAGFADGELTVEAETVDRNGTPLNAEDSLVKTDHDNDPSTPDQGGLDRVDGTITVDVDNTGHITGGTTDVAPGSEVILTITGQDQAGNPLEQQVTATVQPDGSYTAEVPAGFADGELTVDAETVDRNGTPIAAEDSLVKADHDNDPSTPDQGGLDRVDGSITVDVDNTGHITGGTIDVAPGSEVILTITGQDSAGNPLEQQVTATVQPDGSYTAEVPAGFADGELTVEAETVDRNGTPLNAEDNLSGQDGLDRVDGTITVDVDNTGHITGGTTDVAPGSEVILTITGQDQAGNPLEQQVTATVQPDGSYTAEVPAGFADGELTVEAETVDRNGTPLNAEDSLVKTDHDNDPSTPDQGGLDRVDGTITVDVDNTGHITGGTTDVAPGSEVILTITGQDQAGNPLEQQVTATVQPDGSYTAEVPAGFADGELTVEAETVDRNGTPLNAEDSLVKTDHDNDPSTPDQGGLDRVDGTITVDVDNTGHITGGTTDVAPGSEVILTITGQDQAGNPLEQQVTATVQPDGSYTAEVPAGFADGELTVDAETVDRNGTPIAAEDSLVKADHDNDPSTPDQGGLDRVDGTISVDVDNQGHITGGTIDVAPGSEVILTITGQDQAGNPLEQQVTATVQPDGSYTAEVPAGFADGELTVEAETVDRNGTPIAAEDSLVKTDHDNDPSTPDQGGLDRVDGSITVDVDNTGHITGGTTDVAPGSEVILTITGQDQAGNPLEQQVTATVQADGSYTAEVPAGFADGELTVEAETVDRNGTPIAAEDSLVKTDHDNDPSTPDQGGLDRVDGTITVDVDNTGHITGGTTDVAPGSEVILTITGQDQAGNPLEQQVTATVQPDGSYTAEVPAGFADGELTVEAETVDRNGTPVNAEDSLVKTDHDNDPSTPDQGGLDRVDGTITVDVDNTGHITGGTTDVAPGSEVILTITGQDQAGNPLEQQVTATVQPDGSYTAEVPAGFADGELTVEAETVDRNGTPVNAEDNLSGQDGLDRVDGTITVDVDNTGHITGGTSDVAPGSEVILTITGQDQAGNPLEQQVTATVQPDGSYTAEVPAGFADGELTVEAETVDRNGTPLNAEDNLSGQGGLDRVDGTITVDVDNTGHITGGTTDVAPGSEVILTITGQDQAGNPLEQQVTATVNPDGSYTAEVPAGFADGELTVEAETVDRNGTPLNAEDSLLKTDHDNDPSTPDQGGLDRVDGTITVDVDNTGHITGGTTDVAPGSEVILTITGQDQAGNPLEQQVTATVQPDGSYTAEVPAGFADGELTVEAETVDRNGTPLNAEDSLVKTDHDNDPSTPDQGGLDRVDGTITVDVDNTGHITGGTTDVAPGSEVILTITGQDQAGNPLEQQVTATVQPDGSYTAEVPAGFADGELTVEAETVDRNGTPLNAEDSLVKTDHDNDPSTPDQGGLDRVDGTITVDVDNTGHITGGTTDVAPGSEVILTITGQDQAGNPLEQQVTATVQPDGSYTAEVPAGFADGELTVEAETVDRNGTPLNAEDNLSGQDGLDRVDGTITVDVDNTGHITGGTTDVAPGSEVILTITGQDQSGNPLEQQVTATVQPDGSYTAEVPAGFADGELTVEAETVDRNGTPLNAEDSLVKTDHDNDPSTPDQGGLDRVDGTITVDVDNTGHITGGTTDVAPGSEVILTITGQDQSGNPLEQQVTATVQPDGSYTAEVPAGFADGELTVEAETVDRNGTPLNAEDSLVKTDHDNDPSTPDQGGLDRVDGSISVDINDADSTKITGSTEDVAPNSKVTLEITSIDENGETLTFTEEVFTNADGEYSYTLTTAQGNATEIVATVEDRNGTELQDNDQLEAVIKAEPTADVNNGDNNVVGSSGNDVLAGDTGGLKTNFVAGQDYNVSVVLDLSGSMLWAMNGTSNPPAGESRLAIAIKGLKAFIQQMTDHDGVINLQIASFSANGSVGNGYNQVFLNVSSDNINQIFTYLDSLQAGGGTYPEGGFNKAVDWFDDISTADFENQTYYLTDGEPNSSQSTLDNAFAPLAEQSKVFAVGVSSSISDSTVSRYDNTDVNGNKLSGDWSGTNHGEAKAIADADKLIAYLIGGSENFIPADVGDDTVKGGAGDDVLFGDAINTDHLTWTGYDPLQYPKYSGYSKLIAYLKAEVTNGAEPTQQDIYDYVKDNFHDFVAADAADPATKGGNDTIYGGAGNDIIIAGAGNDVIYGGSGNDIISTGRGDDTIIYDLLNAADATGGNGTDTWVDYEANDKIEFGSDFF